MADQDTPNPNPNPPAAAPKPLLQSDDPRMQDPAYRTMLAGLGVALGEPSDQPEAPKPEEKPAPTIGRTLSDTMKVIDEQRAAAISLTQAEDKPAETPASTPAAAATPPAAPEPPKPIAVEKRQPIDKVVTEAVRKALEERQPAPAAATPAAPSDTPAPDPFESRLTEAEKDELNLARFSAKHDPKFKDYPDRLLAYFKKVNEYVERAVQTNPDRTFDENDEEFAKFNRQNKPSFDPVTRRRMEREMTIDEVKSRVVKESEKVSDELRQEVHRLKTLPQIERDTRQYATETENFIASDENSAAAPIVQQARESGWDAVLKQDRVFAPIVKGVYDQSTKLASEYVSLRSGVKPFDAANQDHQWLLRFSKQQADAFQRGGGDALIRNGKSFVTPSVWAGLTPQQRDQHWTFGVRDVLERLAANTKHNIELLLKEESDRLEASGFKREIQKAGKTEVLKTETPPAKTASAAAPPQSPRSTPSAAPGLGQSSRPAPPSAFPPVMLAALGLQAPAAK